MMRLFAAALLLAALLPLPALANVNFDAASQSNSGAWTTSASTVSWTHTFGAANEFFAVAVYIVDPATPTVSSVSAGATSLAKLDVGSVVEGSNTLRTEIWYTLTGPGSGAQTITVTLSGAAAQVQGQGVSYSGVNALDGHALVGPTGNYVQFGGSGYGLEMGAGSYALNMQTTAIAGTLTTTVANDGLLGFAWARSPATLTAGASTTARATSAASQMQITGDSDGGVPTGVNSLNWSAGSASVWPAVETIALAPGAAGALQTSKLVGNATLEGSQLNASKLVANADLLSGQMNNSKIVGYAILVPGSNVTSPGFIQGLPP